MPQLPNVTERFRCRRYLLNDQVSVVAVRGDVDLETTSTLEAMLLAALASEVRDVIVDLNEVTLLDSTGLSALVKAWHVARERGGSIRLSGASRNARKVLFITALDQVLPMYDNIAAAAASWGTGATSTDRRDSTLSAIQAS